MENIFSIPIFPLFPSFYLLLAYIMSVRQLIITSFFLEVIFAIFRMESRLKRGISGSGPPTRFYNMSWKRRHSCEESVRDDGTFSFIFRPHTFSSLLVLLGFLSYVAFSNEDVDDFNTNVKRGLYAVAVVFVAFG